MIDAVTIFAWLVMAILLGVTVAAIVFIGSSNSSLSEEPLTSRTACNRAERFTADADSSFSIGNTDLTWLDTLELSHEFECVGPYNVTIVSPYNVTGTGDVSSVLPPSVAIDSLQCKACRNGYVRIEDSETCVECMPRGLMAVAIGLILVILVLDIQLIP